MDRRGLTRTDWLVLAVAAVYIVLPVDLIPELLTGPLGLTDDVAAFGVIAATVLRSRSRLAQAPALAGQQITPTAPNRR